MELRQLKYFLAVADARSFASAANALYISRQAISKAISQLETELGVELFSRDSGGAFLTPAGLMFYDRIRSNVIELEQVRAQMQHYGKRYQQQIHLAFSVGLISLYEDALLSFIKEQNNLALEYWECPEEQCLEQLRDRKANLVFLTSAPQDPDLEVSLLTRSPYGVLLQDSDRLSGTVSLGFEDLGWLPLSGIADAGTQNFCSAHRLSLQYKGSDLYRLFSLTRQGQCAMLLPQCLVPAHIPGLRWVSLERAEPWELYCVCLKSIEHSVLYRTTVDELQSRVFAPQSPGERSAAL